MKGDFYERKKRYYKRNKNNISKLEIILCNICNLNCKYCYAKGGTYSSKSIMLSTEKIKKILDQLIIKEKNCLKQIMFFGGEPLINFKAIKFVIEYFKSLKRKNIVKEIPFYTIVTNATLVTDEIANYLSKNKVIITVSLDGPENINDNLRIDKNKEGSFKNINKGIKLLEKYNCNLNTIECTYTTFHKQKNISKEFLHKFFSENYNFKNIMIINCSGDTKLAISEDEYIKDNKDIKLNILNLLNSKNKIGCQAGRKSISISPDGNIYPCHYFYIDKINKLELDRINKDIMIFNKHLYKKKNSSCNNCWLRNICNQCPATIVLYNKNKSNSLCSYRKRVYKEELLKIFK